MEQDVAVGTWYVIHGGDVNLWFNGKTYTDETAQKRLENLIKDLGFLKLSRIKNGTITQLPARTKKPIRHCQRKLVRA